MLIADYPQQEPPSAVGLAYGEACATRSAAVTFDELRYGDNPYQSIAIYRPEKPNGILFGFSHGGGWTGGYKEWMGFMAPVLNASGITFASIGYRLAPQHLFPTGVEDIAQAIALLSHRCSDWGCDPRSFFLGGHSAGGHYAALLAVTRDWQKPLGLDNTVIRGCLPISGVYRFGDGSGLSMRPRFLGPEGNGMDIAASPVLRIDGTPPPFLMAHGDRDFPHLITQAEEMERALETAGGDVTRLVLRDADHFQASLAAGDDTALWAPTAIGWMKERAA
ncbi:MULTISPECIES: alpha/beta hydrolase [unclassified Beijerinckia]|uniref:alpha/beta hydrolase n=1 Tax=unclassified Beijerinckia TaxID=2638183 RepID=UPI0008974808|nr:MULTISPECIES: alpha/beta hydrolase [unclassified Beijerinckia]MDH7796215.1 arylformamidase [Beijerinckia sp. GAS462]SEC35412.1 Acetyl esterase/lipase [Beijerinckia sp. 28-YEA-48]